MVDVFGADESPAGAVSIGDHICSSARYLDTCPSGGEIRRRTVSWEREGLAARTTARGTSNNNRGLIVPNCQFRPVSNVREALQRSTEVGMQHPPVPRQGSMPVTER